MLREVSAADEACVEWLLLLLLYVLVACCRRCAIHFSVSRAVALQQCILGQTLQHLHCNTARDELVLLLLLLLSCTLPFCRLLAQALL
jgi:hypothetical protein